MTDPILFDIYATDSPSPGETGTQEPVSPPPTVDIGFNLTAIEIGVLAFFVIGLYALGKLAQIWLKDYLKQRKGGSGSDSGGDSSDS